jgi:HSP20 family protein
MERILVIILAEKDRISVLPDTSIWHDRENYMIEIELPGVDKKDIEFEASESGFCLKAPRDDIEYVGCWFLSHSIDPEKVDATFKNGLLKATVPIAERFEGTKIPIK